MCNRMTLAECSLSEKEELLRDPHNAEVEILELTRDDAGKMVPTLINGRPIDRAKFLEVVRIGNQSCTATLVGKNCALTAAHCGSNGSRGPLEIYGHGSINYRVVQMPQYSNRNAQYDLSILVLDSDVDVPGLTFAKVGLNHAWQNGQDVDIAGYGCTRPGGGGGNDGILRWGESRVTGQGGTDIITQWRQGSGAALCFGDSGGPMFADGSDLGGQRTIIAINSKGNIRDTNYNMMLQLSEVKTFFEQASNKYGLEIYGFNAELDPDEPDPPPGDDGLSDEETAAALKIRDSGFSLLGVEGFLTSLKND